MSTGGDGRARMLSGAELRRIELPAAMVWGRHDRFVPLGLAEAAGSRVSWPLRVVEDAGHAPHIEQPGAFLDALEAIRDSARVR